MRSIFLLFALAIFAKNALSGPVERKISKPVDCPEDISCDSNASCRQVEDEPIKCECKPGWAGDGHICGTDRDVDGWPDKDLDCTDPRCKADNCMQIPNSRQEDKNGNGIGDACDPTTEDDVILTKNNPLENDNDADGIEDSKDNCPVIPNPDQLDSDNDGKGDACDADFDGDGISNTLDNCPSIFNPEQLDKDNDGVGDACQVEIQNYLDGCPENPKTITNDFRTFQTLKLDPDSESEIDPEWVIYNKGTELVQKVNSDPGLTFGNITFGGVDFEGSLYVDTDIDDDYIGFIFGYQDPKKFYTVMWKKNAQTYWQATPFRAFAESSLQIKLVHSQTGPGEMLRNSLWHTGDTEGEVKLLWKDPKKVGWKERTAYRWLLLHRPKIGLIRLRMFEGENMVADSGNIYDSTLNGGNLGVLCFSQESVVFSDLVYRCNENVPDIVYRDLPDELKEKVQMKNEV